MQQAIKQLGRLESEEFFKEQSQLFFFQHVLKPFFGEKKWEGLLFSLSFVKQIFQIGYLLTNFFFLLSVTPFSRALILNSEGMQWNTGWLVAIFCIIFAISLICHFLSALFCKLSPTTCLNCLSLFASFCLLIFSPLSAFIFKLYTLLIPTRTNIKKWPPKFRIRDKISELLKESELGSYLDLNEQKLILSVVSFKERIVREVMVPRIDVFSLSADTSIQEAAQSFLSEGYSRIPIYHENVDNIIGVLLYKDVLNIYAKFSDEAKRKEQLRAPIEKLVKPVLYTPETKKISYLLQEFRSKQIHLAIVVDEYGGTEGIVTIEDILEELVGEIADEYDIDEETLFSILPSGGWIVDAKMSIIDVEEDLGIMIPQSPEYDTIGGYIFHRAGTIPSKGWRIHHDEFDLEILSSNERFIEKIRITPHKEEDSSG